MNDTQKPLSVRSIFLRIAGFLVFLVVVMQGIGYFFYPATNLQLYGSYTGGGIYGEPKDSLDVVVVGSSDACCAITPLQWYQDAGFTGYTVGKSWASASDMYFMLRKIYKTQSPSVVVLCTDTLYEKFNDNSDADYTAMRTISNWFPMIYYHDNWTMMQQENYFTAKDFSLVDPTKGYYFSTDCEQLEVDPAYMGTSDDMEAIPYFQQLYLRAAVQLCRSRGSEVILTTIPHDTWTMERHNAVAAFAEKHGLAYLDYNVIPTTPALVWDEDTFNYCHMNVIGATKVTTALETYLLGRYSLPDHRGDAAYTNWDTDLAAYRQLAETPAEAA